MKLLSIQSSVRKEGSISRLLSADFLSTLEARATAPVVQRDDREAYIFQGLATGKKAIIITPSAGNLD